MFLLLFPLLQVVFSQTYTSHHQAPLLQSRYRPELLHGNNKMQISSTNSSTQEAFISQTCSMDRQYRFRISTDGDRQTGFSHQNGASNSLKQGDKSPQESYRGSGTSNGLHQPTVQTSSYRFTLASVRTAEEQRSTHNAWNLVSSPSAQQRFSRGEYSSANHRTGVVNGFASSVTVQPKLNGQHNGEVRNGYVLGDKYSKPYVHAPFHYAQSLLKELREISSSVKSFESLTLNEPKAGIQQK